MWVVKECTKCKEVKLFSEFKKQTSGSFGHTSQCKICVKKYRESRQHHIRQYNKKYRLKNKDILAEKHKKKYEANKPYYKEKAKKWVELNRQSSRDYKRKYDKKKRHTDSLYRFKHNIRARVSQDIRRMGYTKRAKSFEILGCSFEVFKQHIERQFEKGMTWDNHGEWHLDHVIPISSATTAEEVLKLNHYTNFQPLWAEDNLKKGAKIIEPIQTKLRI